MTVKTLRPSSSARRSLTPFPSPPFCPKFLTTSEYTPRLRARLDREDQLIADAQQRGWQREVERHQATKRRLEQLLHDLA